jgi:hypothetical protein
VVLDFVLPLLQQYFFSSYSLKVKTDSWLNYSRSHCIEFYLLDVHNYTNRLKSKHMFCNSFMWFIFNLQMRKIYIQYYSILNNIQQLMCGLLNAKNPYLGWRPSAAQVCELPSTPVPCCDSITTFPTSYWPHPIPWSLPSTTHTHTYDTISTGRRRHLHIGNLLSLTLDAFSY